MSSKRKLRRAQAQHTASPAAQPSRDSVRKQTASERFSKAGSDKLWVGLLGWSQERLGRVWLAQAVHDGARSKAKGSFDAQQVRAAFESRVPGCTGKLEPEAATNAVDVWLASGDGYERADPAPKWHLLANLAAKLELGSVTPEELQDDWEAWTSLTLAAGPRAALMASLAQAEQAAVMLHSLTQSERMAALVNLSRAMWTGLAYGDDTTFEQLTKSADAWLQTVGKNARSEPG